MRGILQSIPDPFRSSFCMYAFSLCVLETERDLRVLGYVLAAHGDHAAEEDFGFCVWEAGVVAYPDYVFGFPVCGHLGGVD